MVKDPEQERHDRLGAKLDSLAESLLEDWSRDEVAAHLIRIAIGVMVPQTGPASAAMFLRAMADKLDLDGIEGATTH